MPEMPDWDNDNDDPLNFFRGMRNGCLVSIPMWAVIVYAICFSLGCCHG